MKFLKCAISPLSHSFSGDPLVSSRCLPLVCVNWRVFLKQQLILTMFKRPGNLKGVNGFKKQTELYPYKCQSKSPTSSTFSFNRLSKSNVESTYDLFRTGVLLVYRAAIFNKIVKWQQKRDTFSKLVNLHLTSTMIICSIFRYLKETLHRESNFHQQLALLRSLSPGSLVESENIHFSVI